MMGTTEMKVRLTAEQKQAKLDHLAETYTDTAIKMASRLELAQWCEGIVPNIKSKRKDQLADELVDALKETRDRIALQVIETPTAIDADLQDRKILDSELEDPAPAVAKRLYDALRVIAVDSQTPEALLEAVFTLMTRHTTSEIRKYKPSTLKSRKSAIVKLLRVSCEGETMFKQLITDTVETFIRRYHAALSDIVEELNKNYTVKVSDSLSVGVTIDGKGCLEFAHNALTNLNRWDEVSIALILVTGRRMAEIHNLDTVLTKVDEYTLHFEGQLKTKTREDVEPYNIPTLVPADMVLAGIEYLKEQGRLYQGVSEVLTISKVVNAKVSMALSRAVASKVKKYGISEYKDCRAVYAEIAWMRHAEKQQLDLGNPCVLKQKQPAYLRDILGHGDNDVKTGLTYSKFFVTLY